MKTGIDLRDKINKTGFTTLLKQLDEKCSNLLGLYCIIHMETLCAKQSFSIFNEVINDVSKIINYIRAHTLRHCEFKCFLKKGGLDDNDLLYYCDVRWLLKTMCLNKFID